jgi:hypothetical protein
MKLIKIPFNTYAAAYNADGFNFHKEYNGLLRKAIRDGGIICGGSIRRLVTNTPIREGDIDLYNTRRGSYKLKNTLYDYCDDSNITTVVTNASLKCGDKLQVINGLYPNGCLDVFTTYDFSVCCFATDLVNIWGTEQAFADMETNTLAPNIHYRKYPKLPRAYRIKKYTELGYKVGSDLLEAMYNKFMEDNPTAERPTAGTLEGFIGELTDDEHDSYVAWLVDLGDFGFNELDLPNPVQPTAGLAILLDDHPF